MARARLAVDNAFRLVAQESLSAAYWMNVRAAQRLRHEVFAGEMGALLATAQPGLDVDPFDLYKIKPPREPAADIARKIVASSTRNTPG